MVRVRREREREREGRGRKRVSSPEGRVCLLLEREREMLWSSREQIWKKEAARSS
jgi:hypothetical protein